MAQPTLAQQRQYQFHRRLCLAGIPGLGPIGQSTLEHRTLQGALSAASPTGNVLYTGPAPAVADQVATTTKVWAISQPMPQRGSAAGGSETTIGRQGIPLLAGQCPAIDDYGNAISIAHDDLFIDAGGVKFRVQNPALTPDGSLWSFHLVAIR